MESSIQKFIDSLAVPATQIDSVHGILSNANVATSLNGTGIATQESTSTACELLSLLLGETKVDTKPVDQATANENWSVFISH
jgi:hypothetical protein